MTPMCLAPSLIAAITIVVFLGGAAFGMLALVIISIHRTSRGPLSATLGEHPGSISRRLLTGGRTNRKEGGK
jgi:hypothetical protein